MWPTSASEAQRTAAQWVSERHIVIHALEAAMKTVAGTARSMGIQVEG
jgi:ribosomal protein L11